MLLLLYCYKSEEEFIANDLQTALLPVYLKLCYHGYELDRAHIFCMSMFDDFDRFMKQSHMLQG